MQDAGSQNCSVLTAPGGQSVVATEQRVTGRAGRTRHHAPGICHACPRSLQCSFQRRCLPRVGVAPLPHRRKTFVGSRATYLACGWRDSPPNALYSTLCRLLQQMTRSQQMDELLDVLIESGGTHCYPVPLPPQCFPSTPALAGGAQWAQLGHSFHLPSLCQQPPRLNPTHTGPPGACSCPAGLLQRSELGYRPHGLHREKGRQGGTASALPTESPVSPATPSAASATSPYSTAGALPCARCCLCPFPCPALPSAWVSCQCSCPGDCV